MVLRSPHKPLTRTTQDIRLLTFDTTHKAPSESNFAPPVVSLFLSHAPLSASPPPFQAVSYIWGNPNPDEPLPTIHPDYFPMTVAPSLYLIVQEVVLAWKGVVSCGSGEGVVMGWEDIRDALQLLEWMILSSNIDPKYRRLHEFLGGIMSSVVRLEETLNAYRLILRKGKDYSEKTTLSTVLTHLATAIIQEYGPKVLCYHRETARWAHEGLPSAPGKPTIGATDRLHWPLHRTAETTVVGEWKLALFLQRIMMSTAIRIGSEFTSVPGQEDYRKNSDRSSSDVRILSMFEARHSTQSSLVKPTHCTQSLVKAEGERTKFLRYLTAYRAWLEETLNLPHHPFILHAPVLTSDTISLHQTHITYSSQLQAEAPRAPSLSLPERSEKSQLESPGKESSSPDECTGVEMKDPPFCVKIPDEGMFETFMRMNISRAVSNFDSAPSLQGIDPIHRQPHHIVNLIASLKGL
ncbi:hypothetical protein NEUTE1DRAFT_111619 [Neurospora tetrasperma FGSC 2508]|uniref:Uncharacterized protein n=1 Tax=Neurospora tetrasperma (strain FGSC 2508 / ATCC MYA-4615 / P0657) TaxID=510951 RepID=F8MSA7_NEUT8|nr:uncharacterized protein NEUTE1DRAFT_111619 [Neurospora tetrasperma FGSC 2508]EGO55048.1 hypothetical protein NEUTE1DRAFT_111619 [Neurospora tetrasperma FGSC 2508]EGZ69746.1 hypothetical protein NEUTE2DRAFT_141284 [Neurospora tetrasperma FGSC 2509]